MKGITEVFIDIETVPMQSQRLIGALADDMRAELESELSDVKAPGNYKDAEKIAEFVKAKRGEIVAGHKEKVLDSIHRTSLDGAYGEVYCVGLAFDDEAPLVITRGQGLGREDEHRLLSAVFAVLGERLRPGAARRFIGHNVVGFDFRFLWQRSMVLGVRPPPMLPRDPKPWSDEVFDTMVAWAGVRDRVKLSKLCRAFDIDDTDTIDGSEVWGCVQRGEYDKVADHCAIDISKTRAVYRRMTFEV